jgi:protein-tyrosine phosphatase/nicotinamidase-related amidase
MPQSILVTQCLQNDFVQPIGRHDKLPNLLHVGFDEAQRLMGEDPAEGPVARVMRWAYDLSDDRLRVVHIRDWHDSEDPNQKSHLEQFGTHCIRDTSGAAFAFDTAIREDRDVSIVNSLTLNDFVGTGLSDLLEPYGGQKARIGLIGVWTEAKITFLAYELCTRFPEFELGVCSALTASSSRANHFIALDQLERLLGVAVFHSVGEFTGWLAGETVSVPLLGFSEKHPEMRLQGEANLGETDGKLLRYMFRDCRSVECALLDGGYSGNVVLGARSVDLQGHRQAAHVVKIGDRASMGQERTAFERIESVLGNAAPSIADFADLESRGGIKYRYASVGSGPVATFQKKYMAGLPLDDVRKILDTVFVEQLGRLYAAAEREECDLLSYYQFDSRWAGSVRRKVEKLLGVPAEGPTLRLADGTEVGNICNFYEKDLDGLPRDQSGTSYLSYVHGDLNGANIIIDQNDNVWLIDFFHTHRGHVLRDLIKLENDLLYIFTPLTSVEDLPEAFRLTDLLLQVKDLANLPEDPAPGFQRPEMMRTLDTVRILRSYYPELIKADRDPLQLIIAQLRYAVHTLGFFESSDFQKQWALYTAARCTEEIVKSFRQRDRIRVDWLADKYTAPGKVGLTLLPGRRDYGRNLDEDLDVIAGEGIRNLVALVPQEELTRYGVDRLVETGRLRGFEVRHQPIVDQKVLAVGEMGRLVDWIDAKTRQGERVLIFCVGGLGRSGIVAGSYLKSKGLKSKEAIGEVRRARSPRAIETKVQEEFVREFEHKVT